MSRRWVPLRVSNKVGLHSDNLKFTPLDCSVSHKTLPDMSFVDSAFTFQSTIYFIRVKKLIEIFFNSQEANYKNGKYYIGMYFI